MYLIEQKSFISVRVFFQNSIDDGQIVLMGSYSGHRIPPPPSTRFYSATKFAVRGLLEAWRQEVVSFSYTKANLVRSRANIFRSASWVPTTFGLLQSAQGWLKLSFSMRCMRKQLLVKRNRSTTHLRYLKDKT